MKKVFIATLLFTTTYGHMAQAANDLPTKEAYKAMLNLFTYNAEGKLIKSDVAFTLTTMAARYVLTAH